MTVTLLDLYNTTASQEWSMYDNDATSDTELEEALVLAINKAITEIYSSYNFPFRERTHLIMINPQIDEYDLPNGLIKRDKKGDPLVRLNSQPLKFIENTKMYCKCYRGIPDSFMIKNNKLILFPIPSEKALLTVDYYTLVVGESTSGEELYSLKHTSDTLMIPPHLEILAKDAIITRTILNSIASETDENFSAYKKQADKALRLFIKYANGIDSDKSVML